MCARTLASESPFKQWQEPVMIYLMVKTVTLLPDCSSVLRAICTLIVAQGCQLYFSGTQVCELVVFPG